MKVNSTTHLSRCSVQNFRLCVDWRLGTYNISKQSTIWVEWKFLRLLYKREVGRKIDEIVGRGIRGKERPFFTSHQHVKTVKYILGPLTDEFDLDLSVKDKPTLCVEDLLALPHYHWCFNTATVPHERYRVQFPLLLLMTAYTSSGREL